MYVGIDFGTCFSSASVMMGNIPVSTYVRSSTDNGVPSAFMYNSDINAEQYGDDCDSSYAWMHADDVIRYVKKKIRENAGTLHESVESGGRSFTYEYIVEKLLTYLIGRVKQGAIDSGEIRNTDIEAITVTVPVGIGENNMMATEYNDLIRRSVSKITGLPDDKIFILEEPAAAAISYLDRNKDNNDNQRILVFDLGGGTLDVSIVQYRTRDMTYDILVKEGDLDLGGNNWDEKLADHIKKETGVGVFNSAEEKAKFERSVTDTKVKLTTVDETAIMFRYNGGLKIASVTRNKFNSLTSELKYRALGVVLKALDGGRNEYSDIRKVKQVINGLKGNIDMDPALIPNVQRVNSAISEIDRFVLVGGGSNMPQIINAMTNDLGLKNDDVEVYLPSQAIGKGAAIYTKEYVNRKPVRNRLSHSYGVEIFYKDIDKTYIHVLLPKGEVIPERGLRVEQTYSASDDANTALMFRVYESDAIQEECDEEHRIDITRGIANSMKITVPIPNEYMNSATKYNVKAVMSVNNNGILELTLYRNNKQIGYTKSVCN